MKRYLRVKASQQWLAEVGQAEHFDSPNAQAYPDSVAALFALQPGSLEVVLTADEDADPRTGNLLAEASPPPPPPDTDITAITSILDKQDSDVTAAELKEVVLRALRRMRARNLLR